MFSRYPFILLVALAIIAAVLLFTLSSDTTYAVTYDTSSETFLCNKLPTPFPSSKLGGDPDLNGNPACTAKSAPGNSSPPTTVSFNIPGGSSNFGGFSVVTLSDPSFAVASDAAITDGSKIGGLLSATTLGLLNGPCTTSIQVEFIFYESTTNTGNTITPLPEATPDRFSNLVLDADSDGFGDANSPFVTQYPSFYNPLFDPDLDFPGGPNGGKPPVQALARYTGMTQVPPVTGDWVILSFFQFAPRALQDFAKDPDNKVHIFGFTGATNFSLSTSILQDPTAFQLSPSPISDFCTPLAVRTMLLGTTPGGQARLTLPGTSGTRESYVYSFSQRDADNDGIENALDTCPFTPNTGADGDNDGIDDACDGANTPGGTDQDGDGFSNRQDICPQNANAQKTESESENQSTYTASAPDAGPKDDDIGDNCDPTPATASGQGAFITDTNIMQVCVAAADTNNDGVCDGTVPWSPDSDFDGWSNAKEASIGTDPNDKCANTSAANDEADDQWPPDFDDNRTINIVDVLALKPVFGKPSPRHDMDASGGNINIVDVLALKPVFNKVCSDRLTGAPPN